MTSQVLDGGRRILTGDDMPWNRPFLGSVADITDARTAIELSFFSEEGDFKITSSWAGAKLVQCIAKELKAFSHFKAPEKYYFPNIMRFVRRRILGQHTLRKNVGCDVGLIGKFPAVLLHPAEKILTGTYYNVRGGDARAFHE